MTNWSANFIGSLRRNVWAMAAFLIPLSIRSIPEILSLSAPLGLDTLRYLPTIQSGEALLSIPGFFHNHLFFSFATVIYHITLAPILIIKVSGPVIFAILCFSMYLFSKKSLGWIPFKSFIVALLTATYFVSLRISWDLYSQTLGIIFLLITLLVLGSTKLKYRYAFAFLFMVLTVLSHELATALLFFIVAFEVLSLILKNNRKDAIRLLLVSGCALIVFLLTHYSPEAEFGIAIGPAVTGTEPSVTITFVIIGLLLYCYLFLFPFVTIGFSTLRNRPLKYWSLMCLGIALITAILPDSPLYYWNRWVFLLVYPLLFFTVEGLDRVWHLWSNHKNSVKNFLPKLFAFIYICFLLTLSFFYISSSPQSQISFFGRDNHYLAFIPSSMLQNTIPIADMPALIACFQWVDENSSNDTSVIMHYALYDLSLLYVSVKPIIVVNQSSSMWNNLQNQTTTLENIIKCAISESKNNSSEIYTVWWVNEKGWYGIPSLPSSFSEVFRSNNMAVYRFSPLS